ncbi:MAG: hypothetical protein ACYYKD_06750 [Rhodospirillales bacterium]
MNTLSRRSGMCAWLAAPGLRGGGRALAFCMALALAAVTAHALFVSGLSGSEDNLLFYMMGLNLFHGPELAAMADRAIAFYTEQGADEHALFRLQFRKTYLNEFPAPGAVYYGVGRIFKPLFDPAANLYPLFLTQVLAFGLFAAVMLAAAVSAGIMWMTGRTALGWAFALTLAFFAMTEYSPFTAQSFATILNNETPADAAAHIFNLLFRPSAQFSPLGFAPRGQFALLTIAVFALRWIDRPAASYWLAFALSFVHLGSSGMMLAVLAGLDLVLRPERLKRPAVIAPVVIAAVLFAARQSMWEIIGAAAAPMGLAFGVVVLTGLVLGFAEGPRAAARAFAPVLRVRAWLLGRGPVLAELILLAFGWVVSAAVLYAVIHGLQPFSELETFYFWSRAHGRLMMILWPAAVFGVLALFTAWALKRQGRRRITAFAAPLICAAAVFAVGAKTAKYWNSTGALERTAGDLFKSERRLKKGAMPNLRALGEEEWVLYYAMVKSIDHGQDFLEPLLQAE